MQAPEVNSSPYVLKDGFLNVDKTPSIWSYWLLYILNIIWYTHESF